MEVLGVIIGLFLFDLIVGHGVSRWRRNLLAGLMVGGVWMNTDFSWWVDVLAALPVLLLADIVVGQASAERTN